MILALLTLTVLFILGLGILGSRPAHREAAQSYLRSTAARQLALSGLEDVRAKLSHDYFYPPPFNVGQKVFVYSETVLNPDSTLYGLYEVSLDATLAGPPYLILQARSTGYLYENGGYVARWVVDGEFDLCPLDRPGTNPNPRFYDLTTVFDRGAP